MTSASVNMLSDGPPAATGPPADPAMVTAGRAVVTAAGEAGIPVRLMGGVAIWIRASAPARAALGRDYPDIDLVAHKRQARALRNLLEELGYSPERVFNATHGARRLLYHSPDGASHADVFLDTFEMSHTLDLGARLEAEPVTLPAAELLLTKLQIAEVNAKDLSDAAMLLWDHEPVSGARAGDRPGLLNLARLAKVCSEDWGLFTTLTDNLAACADRLARLSIGPPDAARIAGRIGVIRQALDDAPKSLPWRMRAKVGRRVRWYEVPEEVTR
jgi:hypothetical protein